ncbi:MAG: glycerol-3-phosphate 1-O-acyltransferase PlsY [Porcipelethomonas sp.]
MKYVLVIFITAVIAYLFGSCNFAIIVVRLIKGEDIRKFGSGNAGLTNTLRCFGKIPALLTLMGDLLKGIAAVIICRFLAMQLEAGLGPDNDVHYIGYIAGFFAIIGHIFPVYYGFKGGKGVLVGVSVFIVIDPPSFGVIMLIFIAVLIFSHYVSLSSITAAACVPVVTFLLQRFAEGAPVWLSALNALLTVPMAALVIFMHRTNIERLKNGTENRFSLNSSKEK